MLKYKYYLLLGLVFTILTNFFQIVPAQLIRHAFDLVADNVSLYRQLDGFALQDDILQSLSRSIVIYATVILLLALIRGLFLFLVRQTIIVMSRLVEYDLKNEIYQHYQSLPVSFYQANNTGDLMNRISEDVSRVRMYLGPSIMYGINLVVLFLMLIPYMFTINPELTLYALLPLPVLSFSIYYVNNIINKRSEEIQKSQSGLSTFVQEAFSGIRVLKSFVREEDSYQRFSRASDEYKRKSLKLTRVNAMFFPLIMSLIGLSNVLVIFIGGRQIIAGEISYGNVAEFIVYVNMLTWPVTALGWVSSIAQRAAASQKRINEFLQVKNDLTSDKNLDIELKGEIEFDRVSFVYPGSGIKALDEVSFHVRPGESLAVIGTTGAGKSTIANLISRLYDATEGEIRLDGHPITDLNPASLRRQIGYVPQDVFLFSDTIANNIAFGLRDVPQEKILEAARNADLYDNVMAFPKQFDTMLGERGITLSGGQKQRVSIARAIVRNPRILILDDALSAVDTNTEHIILNSMKRIMHGRTTIIISHRISAARLANQIIVLDKGRVVERGTHDELLAQNGIYRSLYDKQLQAHEIIEE